MAAAEGAQLGCTRNKKHDSSAQSCRRVNHPC